MAHTCPECKEECRCGGDAGPKIYNDTAYSINCTCCKDYEWGEWDSAVLKDEKKNYHSGFLQEGEIN
jgi:hypothetical protein